MESVGRMLRGRLRALRGALDCTATEQVAVGILLLSAVAALGILWWGQRPRPALPDVAGRSGAVVLPSQTPFVSGAPSERGAETVGSDGTAAPARIAVHVTGAVVAPGVYELPPTARVEDALDAAGGPSDTAAPDALNLAAPLHDGVQVRVPTPSQTPPVSVGLAVGTAAGGPAPPVDLNTADRAALEALPGIGPVTADRIVTYREEIGGYRNVEELLGVRGVGPATLADLSDAVVVR